jgi:hypothetical protein
MKPAAVKLAALVSAEVGGGASKSQGGTPLIVLREDASRLMKRRAIFSDVSKKDRSCVYSYTAVHLVSVSEESQVHEERTFGETVHPPALASSPCAPVRIALGCVSSLYVSLKVFPDQISFFGPNCPPTSRGL